MVYAFRQQPLKALFLVYQLTLLCTVRIPFWLLSSLLRSGRPRDSWSLKRAVLLKVVRHFMWLAAQTGPIIVLPNHLAVGKTKNNGGIWVQPTPQLVTGKVKEWMVANSVPPARIPGYWSHQKGSSIIVGAGPKTGEKVLYHLHGGAYIRLSAHPGDVTANIVRGMLKHTPNLQRAFAIEYRLSSSQPFEIAHPFPSALLDALAGYLYLVNDVGYSPSDIIVAGDSAGGNLALALTRYLIQYQNAPELGGKLPAPPSALVLLSPWCDLTTSHETPGSAAYTCASTDYLQPVHEEVNYAKRAFLGPLGQSEAALNPYISPCSLHPDFKIEFNGFPRTFLVSGGAEVLHDQIITLKHRMSQSIGTGRNGLTYYEAKDAVHDYLVFRWHEPERSQTLDAIGSWLQEGN